MKIHVFSLIFALLLTGCTASPVQESTTSNGLPSATIESSPALPSTAASIPPSAPDYDTYFAEIDPVAPNEVGRLDPECWPDDLVVSNDGKQLLFTDGRILYQDTYGRIQEMGRQAWHGCIFFAASAAERQDAIYRLYLPSGQVDLLVDSLPVGFRTYTFRILSNWEVVWVNFEKLEAKCSEMWTEELTIGGETVIPKEYFNSLSETYTESALGSDSRLIYQDNVDMTFFYKVGIYSRAETYVNATSHESRQIFGWCNSLYGSQDFYPDGTERPEEMVSKNGQNWWLDDYYTD